MKNPIPQPAAEEKKPIEPVSGEPVDQSKAADGAEVRGRMAFPLVDLSAALLPAFGEFFAIHRPGF